MVEVALKVNDVSHAGGNGPDGSCLVVEAQFASPDLLRQFKPNDTHDLGKKILLLRGFTEGGIHMGVNFVAGRNQDEVQIKRIAPTFAELGPGGAQCRRALGKVHRVG